MALDIRYTDTSATAVLTAQHRPFELYIGDVHAANGVDVQLESGVIAIRIYDYDVDKKAAIEAYFNVIQGIKEITFSRPM